MASKYGHIIDDPGIRLRRKEVFTQQFTLPFPVSVNQLYTNVPGKGRVKSKRYREWLAAAGNELLAQKVGRVSGNYTMALYVQRKKDRKRDIGNMEKGVSDFLRAMDIIDDDSLCDGMTLVWDNTVVGCRVVLTKTNYHVGGVDGGGLAIRDFNG